MKFLRHLIGVLFLNEEAFFELVVDRPSGLEAFLVLLSASIIGGLDWIISARSKWSILIGLLLGALAGWWLYAGVIGFTSQIFFGTDVSRPELLRVIGFSMAALAFVSLPYVGWLSVFWYLGAVYRGLRGVFSTSRLRTVVLVLVGFFPSFIAWGVVILIVTTVWR